MTDLSNVAESLVDAVMDAKRYAEGAIDDGISEVRDLLFGEDDDLFEKYESEDPESVRCVRQLAMKILDIRYAAVERAERAFREDGFEVYESDLEAAFMEEVETLEWYHDFDGITDAVRSAE